MDLLAFLEKKKKGIVETWFTQAVYTYPEEAARIIAKSKDPFSNPIGTSTRQSLEEIFEELLNGLTDMEKAGKIIDPVLRMRAVQNFTASEATSVFLLLKDIVRENLKKEIQNNQVNTSELYDLDKKIDKVCLRAFDIFMGCREQIYSFKANHVKSRTMNLLEKADILCEVPDVGTEIIPHDVFKNWSLDD
jgi:hypothetical protein